MDPPRVNARWGAKTKTHEKAAIGAARSLLGQPDMQLRLAFFFAPVLALAACSPAAPVDYDDSPAPYATGYAGPISSGKPSPSAAPSGSSGYAPATPLPQAKSDFPEVVDVLMTDTTGGRWICTGTLTAPHAVLTAAHCLDGMVSFQVNARNAPNPMKVRATRPTPFGGSYEDVANPDIGMLWLETAVPLAQYAEPVDVTALMAEGDVQGGAVRREREGDMTSAFEKTSFMPVSSAVEFGYEHGIDTPLFSQGGDSGAALFLVENGVLTHKVIGVVRQPDPERGLDQQTRIDADALAFLADWTH